MPCRWTHSTGPGMNSILPILISLSRITAMRSWCSFIRKNGWKKSETVPKPEPKIWFRQRHFLTACTPFPSTAEYFCDIFAYCFYRAEYLPPTYEWLAVRLRWYSRNNKWNWQFYWRKHTFFSTSFLKRKAVPDGRISAITVPWRRKVMVLIFFLQNARIFNRSNKHKQPP